MRNKISALLFVVFALSGCSSNKVVYTDVKSEPRIKIPKRINILKCINKKIVEEKIGRAIAVISDDFLDGSVPHAINGPLMDHGKILFNYYLDKALPKTQGLILEDMPLIFAVRNGGSVGVNRFGRPNNKDLKEFIKQTKSKISINRIVKPGPDYGKIGTVKIFKIKAIFTRNDGENILSDGYNGSAGHQEEESNAKLSGTNNESSKIMGLTVSIVDAMYQNILEIEHFQIVYDKVRKRYSIGAGYHNTDFSLSLSETNIESPDSAQNLLIEKAVIWSMDKMLPIKSIKECGK